MNVQDTSAEPTPDLPLEIAHILLIDVVGYSKLLVNEQIEPASLDYRIPHIRLKSNRQNSPHMLLEKKLNDCGELGIKRRLNPAGVL